MITSIIKEPALTQVHLCVHIILQYARFYVITTGLMKIQFFWFLTLCLITNGYKFFGKSSGSYWYLSIKMASSYRGLENSVLLEQTII